MLDVAQLSGTLYVWGLWAGLSIFKDDLTWLHAVLFRRDLDKIDEVDWAFLESYANKIMILATLDIIVLIPKTIFGLRLLANSIARTRFNAYFNWSVTYYISELFKYSNIMVAF